MNPTTIIPPSKFNLNTQTPTFLLLSFSLISREPNTSTNHPSASHTITLTLTPSHNPTKIPEEPLVLSFASISFATTSMTTSMAIAIVGTDITPVFIGPSQSKISTSLHELVQISVSISKSVSTVEALPQPHWIRHKDEQTN